MSAESQSSIFSKPNCYMYEIARIDFFFGSTSLKTARFHNEASTERGQLRAEGQSGRLALHMLGNLTIQTSARNKNTPYYMKMAFPSHFKISSLVITNS